MPSLQGNAEVRGTQDAVLPGGNSQDPQSSKFQHTNDLVCSTNKMQGKKSRGDVICRLRAFREIIQTQCVDLV